MASLEKLFKWIFDVDGLIWMIMGVVSKQLEAIQFVLLFPERFGNLFIFIRRWLFWLFGIWWGQKGRRGDKGIIYGRAAAVAAEQEYLFIFEKNKIKINKKIRKKIKMKE